MNKGVLALFLCAAVSLAASVGRLQATAASDPFVAIGATDSTLRALVRFDGILTIHTRAGQLKRVHVVIRRFSLLSGQKPAPFRLSDYGIVRVRAGSFQPATERALNLPAARAVRIAPAVAGTTLLLAPRREAVVFDVTTLAELP